MALGPFSSGAGPTRVIGVSSGKGGVGKSSVTVNVAVAMAGAGHSVAEVVDVARRVTGRTIRVEKGPRRAGDPPRLVASVERAARVLGWRAQRATLEQIVRDAWAVRSA